MANRTENNFEVSGKVIFIKGPEPVQTKSGNPLTKRLVIIEMWANNKKQEVPFEFFNKNIDCLRQVRNGDWVTIHFQLKGNKGLREGIAHWYPHLEGLSCIKE